MLKRSSRTGSSLPGHVREVFHAIVRRQRRDRRERGAYILGPFNTYDEAVGAGVDALADDSQTAVSFKVERSYVAAPVEDGDS